jgi:predicted GH43/DUF377 family glycosyl hydrolase
VPKVTRTSIRLNPNKARVIIRPFFPFDRQQGLMVIARIMSLPEAQVKRELARVMKGFSARHYSLESVLMHRYESIREWRFTDQELSRERKLLIGAYFTSEYALECAALFNPSLVPHPDQSGLPKGSLRFVMSLRAVGEGHISSISFREGVIDEAHNIELETPSRVVTAPEPKVNAEYDKEKFSQKVFEMGIENEHWLRVLSHLGETFTLGELERAIATVGDREPKLARSHSYTSDNLLWIALSNYEIEFPPEIPMSARVIFPNSPQEQNGIEDARFVRFTGDDGTVTYYATYTAYSGRAILPQLLETEDFLRFRITMLNGAAVENKGLALFPRKLDGKYVMISRQDAENIFIMWSDDVETWREKTPLARPTYPWEFIKLGNCGSPMLVDDGWLVIDHGVGPMRKYCIGAFLLDRDDPSKVIGRLREPLLRPIQNEREGYVPNVVYSCGSLLHNGVVVLPYAMSDYASRIALVDLRDLLSAME